MRKLDLPTAENDQHSHTINNVRVNIYYITCMVGSSVGHSYVGWDWLTAINYYHTHTNSYIDCNYVEKIVFFQNQSIYAQNYPFPLPNLCVPIVCESQVSSNRLDFYLMYTVLYIL